MRPDSNPLLQELARTQQAPATFEAHPDADQLAAFAEETLLPTERLGVLSHLATCPDCREILKVATNARPDTPREASPQRNPHPTRAPFWTWLPWAAAAAGIVAITTILLLHPQKAQPPTTASTTNPQPPPNQQAEIPAEATQPPASTWRSAKAAHSKQPLPAEAAAHSTPALAPTQTNPQLQTESKLNEASAGIAPAPTAIPNDTPTTQAASQTVTVQASPAANAMLPQTLPQTINSTPTSMGGPAAAAHGLRQFSALAARPQWRINEAGQVERSFSGGGGNGDWQQVLDAGPAKLRVISVIGAAVWAGGDQLRLYRSLDNGTTWNPIQLPPKNGAASAITHVRFQSPLDGKIEAADGSSWVTTDGGATWK